jgi:CarD family transcriptional regulator
VAFSVGERVVYPNHGVGVVERVVESDLEGQSHPCYELRLFATNSRVMVPVDNSDRVGIRPLAEPSTVNAVLFQLAEIYQSSSVDWKDRYKQNLDKMKTGRLEEIAEVLRILAFVQRKKALSFREKKMFDRARYMLVSEIAQVNLTTEAEVDAAIEKALEKGLGKAPAKPRQS